LAGYNLPHYIYRDSPFFTKLPLYKKAKWDAKGMIIKHFFRNDADAYVVQTSDVNNRLKKLLGIENVFTVPNTINHYYKNPNKIANKLPPRSEEEFRLLTFSAWYLHKNLEIIPLVIEALPPNLRENIRFILTLPDEIFKSKFPKKYQPYIVNVGPVEPAEGPSLYMECDALFLPTLLECFSASYVEAMAMGKPIITSDLGFARAVCKEDALFADPMEPKDIASTIKILKENKALQKELVKKGFTQLKCFPSAKERADQYLNICANLTNAVKN
jgi:glycosyltransferase involved in cell wall biosynthesis